MTTAGGKIYLSTVERIIAIVVGLATVVVPTYTLVYYFGQQNQKFDDQSLQLGDIDKKISGYSIQQQHDENDIAMIKGELSTMFNKK